MNPEHLQELKKGYVIGNLRQLTIEALRKNGGKAHPYAIETYIRKKCGTAPIHSTLYKELKRMEKDGIAEGRNETVKEKLRRRVYILNDPVEIESTGQTLVVEQLA